VAKIAYLEVPHLRQPYLVMGFEGWPNAAEVSSHSIQYLVSHFNARQFASLPAEEFLQLSALRPTAVVQAGKVLELKYPPSHFYYAKNRDTDDLILFHGVEPHLQWNRYVDLLLDLAERFGVSQIFVIGGTYDYIPHTYPPVVTALFNDDDLKERIVQSGAGLTEYNGPASIHTCILEGAKRRKIRAISLWGHAPHYLQTKNVRVACAVLRELEVLTGIDMDLSELERASEYFSDQVNHLAEQDPKLKEVIEKLETIYRQSSAVPSALKAEEEAKDEKVVYIQAFLKRQEDEEKKKDDSLK
jgi:proteasome assembly chaperone (PAC2) family protein